MGGSNSIQQAGKNKLQKSDANLSKDLQMIEQKMIELRVSRDLTEKIIEATAVQLVDMLNRGTVNSQQVTCAFAQRAGTVGRKLCLITENNFSEAIKIAAQLDEQRRTSGKRNWTFGDPWDMNKYLPPLFGVPISIKDTIDMKGFASTIGLSARTERIQQEDGVIMHAVRNSGQIPFVRSNVPQLAMTFESVNKIWGRAVNPWNTKRAVGGSSGGEGGLIAARCSPIGVGSDLGGSLRVPAEFCGICSLKPAFGRLSFKGHTPYIDSIDGNGIVPAIMGPMARAIDDLALWMKANTDKQMYKGNHDPYTSYPPFEDRKYLEAQKTRYKIGYIKSFQFQEATIPSQRAVTEAVNALRQQGHLMTQIAIPNEGDLIKSFYVFMTGEGDVTSYRKMLQGEDFVDQYAQMSFLTRLNSKCACCFWCLKGIMSRYQPRVGFVMDNISKKETHDYLLNAGAVKRYREEWLSYLKKEKIDFVIAPGFGCQAIVNGLSKEVSIPACYSFMWNILDVPAGSMPITVVKNDEQKYESRYDDDFTKLLDRTAWQSEGLPVGIQVIGFPYDQERVLGIMKSIEQKIKFSEKYKGPRV